MTAAVSLADIEAAAVRLAGHVLDTPFVESKTLSQITGAQIFLKFENLQFTASFKERGALNKLAALVDAVQAGGPPITGVIAASAGNHAQGVAHHAQRLGLRAVIVMPVLTPTVKVERTRGFGAEVVLHGETFDEARGQRQRMVTRLVEAVAVQHHLGAEAARAFHLHRGREHRHHDDRAAPAAAHGGPRPGRGCRPRRRSRR